MNDLDPQRPVTLSPDALVRQVGEEAVILDLASGTYFGLDPVGARIWTLLAEGRTPADVQARIVTEYDVEPHQAAADLARLLAELRQAGLLRAS